jgi:nucleoside-diphosphate-sugar epimerase
MNRDVFITGGTGYLGSRLIPLLKQRGHQVAAVARNGSEYRLPDGIRKVVADPFLTWAVENPTEDVQILDVPRIRLLAKAVPLP